MNSIAKTWTKNLTERPYSPPKTNRASSMGYECVRRLYFERANPNEKKSFPLQAYETMREGTEQEEVVVRNLSFLGYPVVRRQEYFTIPESEISGKIDGFMEVRGEKPLLIEIKTTMEYSFKKLLMIDDFRKDKWWSKYLSQVTVYMRALGQDKMMFVVKDRGSWKIKTFMYEFEELKWRRIEMKCEKVNERLKEGKIPEDNLCVDFMECPDCPFKTFCKPNRAIQNEGFEIIDDPELKAQLDRREELYPLVKEYEALDETIKTDFKKDGCREGGNAFVNTDYKITTKRIDVKANPNPKPKEASYYWKVEIESLNPKPDEQINNQEIV